MPVAPKRICSGCRQAVSGPCPTCRRAQDERRGSPVERGYDAQWRAWRAAYIAEYVVADPFCRDCRRAFMAESEVELHHIRKLRDGGAKCDAGNVMALCHECHSTRTAKGE